MAATKTGRVPAFDRKCTLFLDFGQQIQSRMRATKTNTANRAPLLVLHMISAPRRVCPSAGGGHLDNQDGVARTLEVPRNYFAPEAADAIYQRLMRFMRHRRAAQPVDEFIVEFDPLRSKAESEMDMGTGFPEQFASILRMHNAGLPHQEK